MNVKFQRTKKVEVFSQGTDDCNNLRCETLYVADYEYVNISSFAVLDMKRDRSLYSFKFIQSEASNLYIFSHNFIFKVANLIFFAYL